MNCLLSFRSFIAIGLALSGAIATPGFATSFVGSPKLASYAGGADFVFRGVVENVRYVLSSPVGQEGIPLPYTFVTFRVNSVMKGTAAGSTVTLRFLGGLDERTGNFMSSDQTPLFDEGDDDILFATRSGGSLSSLVRNKAGRFRVIENQIYSDEGQEVSLGPDNIVRVGKRHEFPEVQTNRIGGRVMNFQSLGAEKTNDSPSKAITVGAFSQAIEQTAEQFGSARGAAPAFEGDDPNEVIQGPDMTPVAPPGSH